MNLTLAALLMASVADSPLKELEGPKNFPAKVSVSSQTIGNETHIKVFLDVEKGWEVYANPVGLEDLRAAQLNLSIQCERALKKSEIKYPPGDAQVIKDFGEIRMLKNKVIVQAVVERTEGDKSPLELRVHVMVHRPPAGPCLVPHIFKTRLP